MSDVQVGPGVYRMVGQVFVVKLNREKTRCYAKKLVESSERVGEEGGRVGFDFEYAPGAIYDLRPEDRMPLDEAKRLMVRYGRCIACGKTLKLAVSVERGIGPVCIKYFGPIAGAAETFQPNPIEEPSLPRSHMINCANCHRTHDAAYYCGPGEETGVWAEEEARETEAMEAGAGL